MNAKHKTRCSDASTPTSLLSILHYSCFEFLWGLCERGKKKKPVPILAGFESHMLLSRLTACVSMIQQHKTQNECVILVCYDRELIK
jgi:hypothetical protein